MKNINELKSDVVKILDDNGLDSTVDGFTKEITTLTNEQKEEIADKIIQHIFEENAYKKAYYILMKYWDSLPDEEKPEIDKKLKELGL